MTERFYAPLIPPSTRIENARGQLISYAEWKASNIVGVKPGGIYVIENLVNNHRYVGSAVWPRKRRSNHLHDLRHGKHHNPHLQHAFDKYGEAAFEFTVVIMCHPEMLLWYEQQFLDQLQPEYNMAPAVGSQLGIQRTPETREKISRARQGRPSSPETCERISAAKRGKPRSSETREKIAAAKRGKHPTQETRAKMSEAQRRRWAKRRAKNGRQPMVNIPQSLTQTTDRQLYELISNLRNHRTMYGHGHSDEAATVRRYVKVELRRVRGEMRRRRLNVHSDDGWGFPGVTDDNAQRDADWRDQKQMQADALI